MGASHRDPLGHLSALSVPVDQGAPPVLRGHGGADAVPPHHLGLPRVVNHRGQGKTAIGAVEGEAGVVDLDAHAGVYRGLAVAVEKLQVVVVVPHAWVVNGAHVKMGPLRHPQQADDLVNLVDGQVVEGAQVVIPAVGLKVVVVALQPHQLAQLSALDHLFYG